MIGVRRLPALIVMLAETALQFAQAVTKGPAELGQTLRAKHDQHNDQQH